jgi:hypothetical protein
LVLDSVTSAPQCIRQPRPRGYLKEGTYHTRLFRGPSTNGIKSRMVLAAPGPLLTPPPSSSPPKTPHRSYSAQTRSQNEEKNLPPKQYLPLQTRTRHRRSHRPHVPKLMRGTPSTMRSPPHQSRPTENPSTGPRKRFREMIAAHGGGHAKVSPSILSSYSIARIL